MLNDQTHIITEIDSIEANVSLRSDGIVYVFFKEHAVLDVAMQMRLIESYHTVTESKLMPFLFMADTGVTITKEARDNAITWKKNLLAWLVQWWLQI